MDKENKRLDRLDALLHALPFDTMPMALSELDGYITGLLACPEMILPSECLPHVWGETGDAQFPDQRTAEKTIGAVMEHYNSVAGAMTRSLWCEPIYEIDPNSDGVLWEPWVDGFTRAMRLRPDAWEALLDHADDETRGSMIFLMVLPCARHAQDCAGTGSTLGPLASTVLPWARLMIGAVATMRHDLALYPD